MGSFVRLLSYTQGFCHFGFQSQQTHRALAEAAASSLPPCRLARVDGLLGFFLRSNKNTHGATSPSDHLYLMRVWKSNHHCAFMLLLEGGAQTLNLRLLLLVLGCCFFFFFHSQTSCFVRFCYMTVITWDITEKRD